MKYDKISKNVYRFPFDESLNLEPRPAPKHYESTINALDFAMPIGTPIYAARDGVVTETKDDSDIRGFEDSFRKHCNLIRVKHDNDEYTVYVHLKYKGVCVKKGQKVKEGKLIGYSGDTGYTNYPHLHFAVQELDKAGKRLHLIVKFKQGDKVFIFKDLKKSFV